MKKIFILYVVVIAFIVSGSLAFADGRNEVSNKANANAQQGQKQGQVQQQGNAFSQDFSQNGNNISGVFPYAPQMPSQFPPGYFPGYERQVNDMPLADVVSVIGYVDADNFSRFRARLVKAQGEKFFKELRDSIHIRPTMPKHGLYPATSRVYFVNNVPTGSIVEFMGFMTVDSSLDPDLVKEKRFQMRALTQELHMFAGIDVLQDGVNVMMPAPKSDFFRAYISPSGTQWGLGASGGLLQAFSNLLTGFSPSGQYTSSSATTGMHGDKAITYICFRVPDIDKFLNPPKPIAPPPPAVEKPKEPEKPVCDAEKIRIEIQEYEQKCKSCTRFCFENLGYRSKLGDLYTDLYACTGDKENLKLAIKEYEIAERNYKFGHDIKSHQAEANQIIAHDYYNWAGCIRELYGRDAAMKFASEKKLERIPTGFATK